MDEVLPPLVVLTTLLVGLCGRVYTTLLYKQTTRSRRRQLHPALYFPRTEEFPGFNGDGDRDQALDEEGIVYDVRTS